MKGNLKKLEMNIFCQTYLQQNVSMTDKNVLLLLKKNQNALAGCEIIRNIFFIRLGMLILNKYAYLHFLGEIIIFVDWKTALKFDYNSVRIL